jgi:flagellar hook assembly protein FlgD
MLYLGKNGFAPPGETLTLDVRVERSGRVRVEVFNYMGERVWTILDQVTMTPWNSSFTWDGRNSAGDVVGNGTYFIVIRSPDGKMIRKVIVLK